MTHPDYTNVVNASRSVMVWAPEDHTVHGQVSRLLAAAIPAVGILAVSALMLLAIL